LCIKKRATQVPKKVFLAANLSDLLSTSVPVKYKDPGCPTISCTIGTTVIDKALLDLGAGVNLLPYSVYKQLGVGELKPTKVTLQLADRSVKIPKGEIEDVLIKIGEFIFQVDFIVLEISPVENPRGQIPVILGRPFLATTNVVINCRSNQMKLTFGNMTMDVNIFHLGKQPSDQTNEPFEVNMIEGLPSENGEKEEIASLNDDNFMELDEVKKLFDEMIDEPIQVASTYKERPPIPLRLELDTSIRPSIEEAPKLELKPLPDTLKYAYLSPEETLPVIIASNLSGSQEEALIALLKENKEAIGWTMEDIKGISPSIIQHRIHLTEEAKPRRDP
jgi:hypothetical protein